MDGKRLLVGLILIAQCIALLALASGNQESDRESRSITDCAWFTPSLRRKGAGMADSDYVRLLFQILGVCLGTTGFVIWFLVTLIIDHK